MKGKIWGKIGNEKGGFIEGRGKDEGIGGVEKVGEILKEKRMFGEVRSKRWEKIDKEKGVFGECRGNGRG